MKKSGNAAGETRRSDDAPWLGSGPGRSMPVPTMLAPSEIDYLHWLTSRQYAGAGRICELGCFLGGSTWALASGLAQRHDASLPILTYDAFRMDKETAALFPVGYADGQTFLPLFERYLAPHRDRTIVREMFIPRDLPTDQERAVYPEQQPVEILFVDAAKTWLVHNTILRCFGRHLIPGRSVLVQQDFKHFGGYWIPLHMWQLRECFEPLHDVRGGATHSFLYTGGLADRLADLWRPESIAHRQIDETWDRVSEYWGVHGSAAVGLFMQLCRATHLAAAGFGEPSTAALESIVSAFKPGRCAEDEPVLVSEFAQTCAMASSLLSRKAASERIISRLKDLETRGLSPDLDALSPAEAKRRRWARIGRELHAAGLRRIALYGAGRHTAEVLRGGWITDGIEVAAVLDDFAIAKAIEGVPVFPPSATPPVDAVVISSETFEESLFTAATKALGARYTIIRPYGGTVSMRPTVAHAPQV